MNHQLWRPRGQRRCKIRRMHIDHRRLHGGVGQLHAHRFKRVERAARNDQLKA